MLRILDEGLLTDLNHQRLDLKKGWVSNEAWHEESQNSNGHVFSTSCSSGECINVFEGNTFKVCTFSGGFEFSN